MRGFDNDWKHRRSWRASVCTTTWSNDDTETLGMTPGEAAGIPTGDGFRWLTVLREATKAEKTRIVTPAEEKSKDANL